MIPTRHAELLNLPPETSPREAQGDCLPLQQELLAINPALPPPKKPLSGPEEVLNDVSNGAPPETAPTPQSGAEFCGTVPVEFLSVLDLDENANAEQALAKAQARLKETVDAQSSLKPRHPAHPKLKRDRARFEQMTAELREIVFSGKVDALCDRTEEALECRPPNRAKARDCVRRARTEGTHLQPESACLRRLQKLEVKLEGGDADSATAPISNETASAPASVHAAPPFVAPVENPFLRLESLVDKGMACLAQDYPDVSGAIESSAEAQAEADGKEVPSNLRSRMQLFKRTLEQVRREAIHARVDECLRQAAAAMAQDPPATDETREKLHLAESLLKEAPDSYFRSEVARLERVIEEHEHWLSTRRSNEMELLAETRPAPPPIEAHPLPAKDDVYPTMPWPRAPKKISVKVNPKARAQILPLPPPGMAPMAPEMTPQPPVQPVVPLKPTKRSKALEIGVALLLIGLISAACASFRIAGMLSTLMGHSGNIQSNQPVQPSEFFAEKPASQTSAPLFSRRPEIGELSVSV
ncbi:MAG TPA: hypothetical protein VG754_13185, partial [Verrucomicrobiae bacterium]|nr:hypothetical protein [Verrucomicrobiae bacterium]